MNEKKQKQLFAAARTCVPAEVPSNFPTQVLSAIGRTEAAAASAPLFEQLSTLFPRLATVSLIVIAVAMGFEWYAGDDIASQLAQASDQWLLPMDWL
jgi:hypothetical protein